MAKKNKANFVSVCNSYCKFIILQKVYLLVFLYSIKLKWNKTNEIK